MLHVRLFPYVREREAYTITTILYLENSSFDCITLQYLSRAVLHIMNALQL